MAVPQQSKPQTGQSPQQVQNQSFDEKYNVLAVELLAENSGGTALNRLKTDAAGNMAISPTGLVPVAYDYMSYTNTNSTTDTFVYKTGGSGGTTVATVTIVYTDTTKSTVSTVTRT